MSEEEIEKLLEERNKEIWNLKLKIQDLQSELSSLKEEYKNEQLAELKELNNYVRKDKIKAKIKEQEAKQEAYECLLELLDS